MDHLSPLHIKFIENFLDVSPAKHVLVTSESTQW